MQAAEVSTTTTKVAGRYVLESLLGRGGMAKVFRARDLSLGRHVALKMLTSSEPTAAALFEEEYHALAGLRHPCIIEVRDYGVSAEGAYYTMELLDGKDVGASAPLHWRKVCECLRDVGSALALVHRRELVHRDISPRNIWQTSNGAFKVIDFGALCRFGVPKEVVGTPAYLAPESLTGEPLDQRADLYSLGAVAYYLLTGRNAYPARVIADVLEVRPKPVAPSVAMRVVDGERDDDRVPPELDDLVLSLLSRTPLARPSSAAEVIERAGAIAGLSAEGRPSSIQTHLVSTDFVARLHEKQFLADSIVQLEKGTGGAIVIEAPPGQGKTRLLREIQLDARLAGMTALHSQAELHPSFHGVALHLAFGMLDSLPEVALEAGAPLAGTLGHLSQELHRRLGQSTPLVSMPPAPGEARMRIQEALLDWFRAVSKQQKLALFVDDLHQVDEGSAAFLAALARESKSQALLLVATLVREDGRSLGDSAKALRAAAQIVPLPALDLGETRALLRSAFGDVPHLPRLAEKLHQRSTGNPRSCMDFVHHLVRQDVVRHQGGEWILPQELRDEQLPVTSDAVLVRTMERLSATARTLSQALLLSGGVLSVDACVSLLDDESPGRVSMAVDELLREGVAIGSRGGCRLVPRYGVHVGTMAAERAARVHRKLAEAILAASNLSAVQKLAAGLHLLRAGDDARAGELLARGGIDITMARGETDTLPEAIPMLEAALRLYREQNRPLAELAPLIAPLASGAYYAERRLAAEYGDQAIDILQTLLGLKLAARLRPFLGKKLGLVIALVIAAVRLKRLEKTKRTPTLVETFTFLFTSVATLTGVSVICIDPATASRYVQVLEPLTALGEDHVASFLYRYCSSLVMTVEDRSGRARAAWHRLLERLRDPRPIKGMPEFTRPLYIGGALYACGVIEGWADGPGALRFAEELDATGMKLYEMSADQLRAMYYANQGNDERFQYYRDRVETHAIQRGTAWQVEIWSPGALISVYLRNHDAMGMKHAGDVLERLAEEIPSLALYGKRARGAYLVTRGRYAEGIDVLDGVNTGAFRSIVGATRTIGVLARAHNQLGDPAKARALCLDALQTLDAADRELVVMNQIVITELALAEARLGEFDEAGKLLNEMLEEQAPLEGALTLGMLYETLAQVALLRSDSGLAREHLAHMTSWYLKTGLSSLAARSERLVAALERNEVVPDLLLFPPDAEDTSETVMIGGG